MNAKQYIPNSANPFDCDYYGKGFPCNQHLGEHCFNQDEGQSFSQYRHSQAVNMNSQQFIPSDANSNPCGVYGFKYPENQHVDKNRIVYGDVLHLGRQRNFNAINMDTEPYMSRAVNYTVNDISGANCTEQRTVQVHSVIPSGIAPISLDHCESRQPRKEKQTRERTFVCDVCGRGFFEMSSLTVHSRIHSGERPFPCEVCDKTFASREGLRSHLVVHSLEKRFECDLCDKKFPRKQQMQHHRIIHLSDRPHVCDLCQKTFKLPKALKVHMLSHTEERPYACDLCDKKFKSIPQVNRHKKFHAEKTFSCNLCLKKFYSSANLKLHRRVHTGEKPYHCQLCPMRMVNKESFLKHVQSHGFSEAVNIKPRTTPAKKLYMCVKCREEFPEQCELETHQLYHKREKPFACFICRVRFFRSSNLKLHLSVIHYSQVTQADSQGKSSFKSGLLPCEMCKKSYRCKRNLQKHILLHLSQQNSGQRMLPIKQGEFPCDQCGKRFTSRKNLRRHAEIHTARKTSHQCVVCPKKFINRSLLRKHTRIHTENKCYVCHFCNMQYTRRDSLIRHFREHLNEQSYLQMREMISEKNILDEDNNICRDDDAGSDHDENQPLEEKNTQGEFACEHCGKTFYIRRYLRAYFRRVHSENRKKPHQCTVCSKSFKKKLI